MDEEPDSGDEQAVEWGLVLAFDTDDEQFVRGFEAGILWRRLEVEEGVEMTVRADNAEMVMRMAEARGVPFTADPTEDGEWLFVRLGTAVDGART